MKGLHLKKYLSSLEVLAFNKQTNRANHFCIYPQVPCYYVYISLLLKLSNDVEESFSPININEIIDPTYTVCADFNQGNESVFGCNAGKQCVAMSLYSIVYNEIKSVNIWDTSIMNSILINGNDLYTIINQQVKKDFLLLTEVPAIVSVGLNTFLYGI